MSCKYDSCTQRLNISIPVGADFSLVATITGLREDEEIVSGVLQAREDNNVVIDLKSSDGTIGIVGNTVRFNFLREITSSLTKSLPYDAFIVTSEDRAIKIIEGRIVPDTSVSKTT